AVAGHVRPLPRRVAPLGLDLDVEPPPRRPCPEPRPHDCPQALRLGGGGAEVEIVRPVAVAVGEPSALLGVPVQGVSVVGDAATGETQPIEGPPRLNVVALADVLERDLARCLVAHWFLLWMV